MTFGRLVACQITHYASPLGLLRLAHRDHRLIGIAFPEDNQLAAEKAPSVGELHREGGHDSRARAFLDGYFAGRPDVGSCPFEFAVGTPFQQTVWRTLCQIALGEITTYGEIARRIGRPTAARAVGAAIGRNPLAILIPCHRVVGRSGALVGFGGGLERKRWLLAHEHRIVGGRSRAESDWRLSSNPPVEV